jgi:hemoglobin
VALDLPNSALGWCPRFLTGDRRYLWLNRTLFVGVGELRPKEARVDYDLFALDPRSTGAVRPGSGVGASPFALRSARPSSRPLYERLGGSEKIHAFMSAFVDGLHSDDQLQRQNPRIASALRRIDQSALKRKIGDYVCRLAGGPCDYQGRTMRSSHAHLGLNGADWELGANQLARALREYRVPEGEQQELLALIGTTKADIVTRA